MKKIKRLGVWSAVFLLWGGLFSGCYIPGLGALGDADDPAEAGKPGGVSETFYGKFYVYRVGGGKIYTLSNVNDPASSPQQIAYILGEVYLPSDDYEERHDYNFMHRGDGTYQPPYHLFMGNTVEEQTIFYKDAKTSPNASFSSRPEGIVLDGDLALYYTHHIHIGYNYTEGSPVTCNPAWPSDAPETPTAGEEIYIFPNNYWKGVFNGNGRDVDIYMIEIGDPEPARPWVYPPGTLMVFRLAFGAVSGTGQTGEAPAADTLHEPRLSLLDAAGNVLLYPSGQPVESGSGADFWKWKDPELTYNFTSPGTYYLRVEDLKDTACDSLGPAHTYYLVVESPQAFRWVDLDKVSYLTTNHVRKGEIQPARSGSREFFLQGGPTFEPDDLRTKLEDNWPDCDGIPGTGDEGDAGVGEQCYGFDNWGARDGRLQYQELDDKSALDDGEYFIGKPTNIGTTLDSEASVVIAPGGRKLLMFINWGSRIYMLESLDGLVGRQWDLTNLFYDRPAIVPRKERGRGSPTSPVVSSGPLGFCETVPAGADVWAARELADWDTPSHRSGQVMIIPRGYPHTYAVTFGDNHHLDSPALADVQQGNTIYSGPDGIINTFFAPQYVAYRQTPSVWSGMASLPQIMPPDGKGLNGPGNPDNPSIWNDGLGDWDTPLSGLGGDNSRAFLLGPDDEWNPAIWPDPASSPAAYMQKQNCNFYTLAENFDRCAQGVPIDPRTGEEPVAIAPGADRRLDTAETVLRQFRGDDFLCPTGNGDTVAICPGRDGKFGWKDIYIPIKGDDRLALVYDPPHVVDDYAPAGPSQPGIKSELFNNIILPSLSGLPMGDQWEIGIHPGPNGVLETILLDSYTVVDFDHWTMTVGGDHYCRQPSGVRAICPGFEIAFNLYDFSPAPPSAPPFDSRKLMSVWTMYVSSPSPITEPAPTPAPMPPFYFKPRLVPRQDVYSVYDDEFCVVGGAPAICPGPNGFFQSYPLTERVVAAKDEDLLNLYKRVSWYLGRPCYTLVGEIVQSTPSQEPKQMYYLYRYLGVRHDDKIKYDPGRGFYLSTGENGINQSCVAAGDVELIGYNKGLPNQPIISAGANRTLETYPLQDQEILWTGNVKKISTGPDGVANSFVMGDDKREIFFGTGKPDHPCVLSGPDGTAESKAQDWRTDNTLPLYANDTQLYRPGEITGFDAFNVWGPDAVVRGGTIYLYYSGLGWETLPASTRKGPGDLASKGECKRPGLDKEWGIDSPFYRMPTGDRSKQYVFDLTLDEWLFRQALDNNEGVALAPRIGVAVSDIYRLSRNPSDWTIYPTSALDLGQVCESALDFPIDIAIEGLGQNPDTNWNGAYSPDVVLTKAEDEESPLFLLFFSGMMDSEKKGEPKSKRGEIVKNKSAVGLARSLDGVHFEVVRQVNPVLTSVINIDTLLSQPEPPHYASPTVIWAGKDEFGEPMYGMFYDQYLSDIGNTRAELGHPSRHTQHHIGYALRKGKITLVSCSLAPAADTMGMERKEMLLLLVLLGLPLVVTGGLRFFRRRTV